MGRHGAAVELLERALKASPDATGVKNKLAWLYSTSPDPSVRNIEKAMAYAVDNEKMESRSAYLDTLAAALAAKGDFYKATETADLSLQEASKENLPESILKAIEARRDAYAKETMSNLLQKMATPGTPGGNVTFDLKQNSNSSATAPPAN